MFLEGTELLICIYKKCKTADSSWEGWSVFESQQICRFVCATKQFPIFRSFKEKHKSCVWERTGKWIIPSRQCVCVGVVWWWGGVWVRCCVCFGWPAARLLSFCTAEPWTCQWAAKIIALSLCSGEFFATADSPGNAAQGSQMGTNRCHFNYVSSLLFGAGTNVGSSHYPCSSAGTLWRRLAGTLKI